MRPATLAALALTLSFLARPSAAAVGDTPSWNYASPDSGARSGGATATAGDVNGDGYSDLLVGQPGWSSNHPREGRVLLFLGTASGFAPVPSWEFASKRNGARLGTSVAPAGDVNGDGYADVLVGAPALTENFSGEGRAYLFLGSSAGLASEPAWTVDGGSVDAKLGASLSTTGDLDGDGLDDIAIGATGLGAAGSVLVYLGSPSGPAPSPFATLVGAAPGCGFGYSVAAAGDVDGDGRGDLIVGAPDESNGALAYAGAAHLFGMPAGSSLKPHDVLRGDVTNARLGYAVAGIGDLDGDGHADVCAGAPFRTDPAGGPTSQGAVLVAMGGPLSLTSTPLIEGPSVVDVATGGQFGASVAPAGDVNGDGYADFAVGAPVNYVDGASVWPEGYACVYQGTPSSAFPSHAVLAWSAIGDPSSGFGTSVCAAGDGDGDGYGDVVVGSPSFGTTSGRADVFAGHGDLPGLTPVRKRQGNAAFCAGDVNGDGYSDLVDWLVDTGSGNRFLVQGGGPGGVMSVLLDVTPGDLLPGTDGAAAYFLGDVNGDGYDDLALDLYRSSDPLYLAAIILWGSETGPLPDPASIVTEGSYQPIGDVNGDGHADVIRRFAAPRQREIHLGSPTGVLAAAAGRIPDPYYPSTTTLTPVGDTNGDGFGDVAVSYPNFTGSATGQGRVQLYRGNAGGVDTTTSGEWTGAHANDHFGFTLSHLGDIDGDGRSDFAIDTNSEFPAPSLHGAIHIVRGGTTVQYLPAAAIGASTGRLFSPARLGDVNGDGFDDMLGAVTVGPDPAKNAIAVYLGSAAGLVAPPAWTTTDRTVLRGWRWSPATSRGVAAADFDADGFADFVMAGGPDVLHMEDSLLTHVFFGNGLLTRASGAARAPRQRRADANAPIALLGMTSPAHWPEVRLAANARSAAGRTYVRLETEIEDWGTPFTTALDELVTDGPELTGPPGANGSTIALAPVRAIRTSGAREKWRLRIASTSPYFPWSKWFSPIGNGPNEFDLRHVALTLSVEPDAIAGLALAPPAPNPSHDATRISFTNSRATVVDLGVYDASGRRVTTLARGTFPAGSHELRWDGTTSAGQRARAGVYFVRLVAGGQVSHRRVTLVP
ncbi:MAG: FG-GAP repeat protein [Candidatus Eisenbacteria bacterium]|nr:FG-GAP repeat protein [Candidatus Eisenbacteria bacterium]